MPQTGAYRTLTAYNAWANNELYDLIRETPEAQTIEEAPIVLLILNHAYAVSRIFRAHILGETHSYTSANPEPLPLDELAAEVCATDGWYVDYANAAKPAAFDKRIDFRFTSGEESSMSRGEMLLHVVNHSTYHRGNVSVMLQKYGIVPQDGRDKDGLTNFLTYHSPAVPHGFSLFSARKGR